MSRTDLDATTLANSLRMKAGDGSIEWVSEPIQASVLLDIADMLEDYESVRGESDYWKHEALQRICTEGELRRVWTARRKDRSENAKLRELLKAAYKCTNAGPSCLECRIVAGGCTLLSAMRELGVEVDG